MDNFTNKNKIKERLHCLQAGTQCSNLPSLCYQPQLNATNEDNATQLLLMLSQQDGDKIKIKNEQVKSELDLTPWASVNIKLSCQKKQNNSKKSLVLPICGNNNRLQNSKQNHQTTTDNDHRIIFISTQHKRCKKRKKKLRYQVIQGVEDKENIISKCEIVMVNRKNSQNKQSKNSHSTIARYSDHASQWSSTISTHNPNSLCKYDPKKYRTDCNNKNESQSIIHKSIPERFMQAKKYSKTNRENEPQEQFGKLVPIYNKSSTTNANNTKFIKSINSNNNCVTNPILRKNTAVLNELQNRGVSQFQQYMDYVRIQRKKRLQEVEQRKQSSSLMKYQSSNSNSNNYQEQSGFDKEVQQQKFPNQYQKIKRQIVSNIQKQSIIKISLPTNEKTSKKVLVKYLKQNLIKRERDITKAQILDENYQTNNPITKHLYDRYKKLLGKSK